MSQNRSCGSYGLHRPPALAGGPQCHTPDGDTGEPQSGTPAQTMTIDTERLPELAAELGFWPATIDEADIEHHGQHNKNADYCLRAKLR